MTTPLAQDPVHAIPAGNALRASRSRWRLFAFLALAVAALALFGRFVGFGGSPALTQHVARVLVDGTIFHDQARLDALEDLGDDRSVQAVIIAINSPGGSTAGGEELYEAITRLREQKPVVAVINELGASAAYMTAIAADEIFARRLSIVGSIGVLYQHVNAGGLMQNIGIDLDKVATGPLKAEPDIDEALTPFVRQHLQAMVNDSYNWFVDVVAERRAIARDQTLALADGRILTGRQALESQLIDFVGGEEEAIAWLESERGIAAELPVYTAYPLPDPGLEGWLGLLTGEARAALGLSRSGPLALDGLVSLWQVTGS